MGVQITDIIPKHEVDLDSLQGRKISIDAFITLYQFLAIIRQYDGTPLMDSSGNVTSHYSGLFYRTIKLIEKGIKPAYVFDGKPPFLKKRTITKRRAVREEAEQKWKEALEKEDFEAAKKHAQSSIRLTTEMINGSKELLKAMGVPVVQAPSEGEAQAAFMCKEGDVWAAGSQDFDSLLFGTPRLIRNLTITGRRKVPRKNVYVDVHPERIDLEETLKELKIDRQKLIWLGILVGTDFNEKIPGIGPKKALKLVQEFDDFEAILEKTGYSLEGDYKDVENIFLNIDTTKDYTLKWKEPDHEKVKEFLVEQHDFSEDRVNNALKSLEKAVGSKLKQNRLENWFS